jgi:5-methylcytosine-specific restriction endonuclease McrA
MQVLNRDGRRCLVCGRSPMYYVDVELHVHHAIPWGRGGITEEANLISICKTCHDGLEPHEDYDLIKYLAEKYPRPDVKYFEELKHYQEYVRNRINEA